jgi:hypothetical protein
MGPGKGEHGKEDSCGHEDSSLHGKGRSWMKKKTHHQDSCSRLCKGQPEPQMEGKFKPADHQKRKNPSQDKKMKNGQEGKLKKGGRESGMLQERHHGSEKDVDEGIDPDSLQKSWTPGDCQRGQILIK